MFEWIPYDQLSDIKKMNKNDLATSVWKDGPLYHNRNIAEWMRKSGKRVTLKYVSQNAIDELLNKV